MKNLKFKAKIFGIDDAIFWAITAIIVTVIIAIATIYLSVRDYNHRYDSSAKSADSLQITLCGKESGSATFIASAGNLYYGYGLTYGTDGTAYKFTLNYKKTDSAFYKTLKNEFTIYAINDFEGDYPIGFNKHTQGYDIQLVRNNQKKSEITFEFDWAIK